MFCDSIFWWAQRSALPLLALFLIPHAGAMGDTAMGAPHALLIANRGQYGEETQFLAFSQQIKAWLNRDGVVLAQDGDRVEMLFPGANRRVEAEGLEPLPASVNFILGGAATSIQDVPAYESAVYRNLYDGVDLLFRSGGGLLKTEFVVRPGRDHRVIHMRYRGAQRLEIEPEGGLAIHARTGVFREHPPVVYQDLPDGRRYLVAFYIQEGDETVRFWVEDYDRSYPLVIDPALTYSTYLGGNRTDMGTSVAVDAAGSMYVAGYTESANVPILNAIQSKGGGNDAFVFKMNAAGTQLLYATFIGGSSDDRAYGLAVDGSGAAYLCGSTASSNFPTANASRLQPLRGGGKDAFVLKLNPLGNALVYSSYIGGSGSDSLHGCVLDPYNQLYAVGETNSANLPTKSPFQPVNAGGMDAFLLKINMNATLVFSTYFGGSGDDGGRGIALHQTQLTPYVTGYTSSLDFPIKSPAQPSPGGGQDAFVARFNSDANHLVFSTFLGGAGGTPLMPEQGLAIAVDFYGNCYVAGVTSSANFPVLLAYQGVNEGGLDAFFTKHDNGGVRVYSSYLGGAGTDVATAIAVDLNRRTFVAGYTSSNNFPAYLPAQATWAGGYDAFVAQVDVNGSPLAFSSYLGGSGADQAFGLAINPAGEMLLTGATSSSNFPSQSAYQYTQSGLQDMFLARIAAAPAPPSAPVFLSLTPNTGSGTAPTFTIEYTDANGANNVESIQFMVNSAFTGANSCQIAYVHSTGLMYLLNNTGSIWMGGYPPGALNTLSNSQCSLPLASVSVVASGNSLTLVLPLSFATTTYQGAKYIYALALDRGGLRSDWSIRGSWTLP